MNIEEMKEMLLDEYRDTFAQAEAYGRISDLDEGYLEECLTDLGDLLYTAQEKGAPVQNLIGNDLASFCHAYFSEFTVTDHAKHPVYLADVLFPVHLPNTLDHGRKMQAKADGSRDLRRVAEGKRKGNRREIKKCLAAHQPPCPQSWG